MTPSPWYWKTNTKTRQVWLCTPDRGTLIVMDFVRWGMNGAMPRFRRDGIMLPVRELVTSDHNGESGMIDHPDARLIAAAPLLLEACKTAIRNVTELGWDQFSVAGLLRSAVLEAETR